MAELNTEELLHRAHQSARRDVEVSAEQRERIRLLRIVLALSPFCPLDAAPGRLGRPIEPAPPYLQRAIPRQRTRPPRGLIAPFHHRQPR